MKRYLTPLTLVAPPQSWHRRQEAEQETEIAVPAAIWVRLIVLPDPFCYDQALLLSRQSDDEWLAWIPDYGEIILHRSEFYLPQDWN
ncbi:MAG: hypothetical protein IGS50_09365 [Synechococcales cyanobacterium C42_A2020_086]|jgi:hypothetical protein|nr:hypothetical protein [Synechococcales cyanobacterium C42_A2020_086]